MDNDLKNKVKLNLDPVKNKVIKIFMVFLLAIIMFGAGVLTGVIKPWEKTSPIISLVDDTIVEENYILTISTVEEITRPASDLITSKYIYKDADTYENYKNLFGKRVPFTTDKVVFTYKGTVSVGVNLSEVKYEIDNKNKTINIKLPGIEIITNDIDESSFEYPFEADSVFNATGMSDYTDLLATLKEKKEKEVRSDTEFMDRARLNTENVLKEFLTAADVTKDYTVIFE